MGQEIFAGALTLALTFLPINPIATTSGIPIVTVNVEPQIVQVVVKKGDSLSSIAEAQYGSKDFWTNIWNDNIWIDNPSIVEEGQKITIQENKPVIPSNLKPELADKLKKERQIAYVQQARTEASNMPRVPQDQTASDYSGNGPLTQDQINYLGNCESGMTAARNSGNGYYGAFQFSYGTWQSMGTGYDRADNAPLDVQIDAVQRLVQRSSIFSQFPGCSARMRSLGIL